MKKIILVLLAGVLMVSLCACGIEKTQTDENKNNAKVDLAPQGNQSNAGGQERGGDGITLLCDDTLSFSRHFSTSDGYYYLTESQKISGDLYGMHLMYIDYATQKEVYLCSDSGCRHDSEKCSAVFSDREFGFDSLVFVQGDFLYLLNREYDQDGTTSMNALPGAEAAPVETESKKVSLYRMKPDGSSRQKIYTFPANTTTEKMVFSEGDSLWFVTKKLTFQQENGSTYTTSGNRSLVRLDLNKREITETISLEFNDNIFHEVIGGSGTKFVLSGIEYPNKMTREDTMRLGEEEWKALYQNSSTVTTVLDAASGDKKEIYRESNNGIDRNPYVKDGYLYQSAKSGGILKINLDTGAQETLAASLSQNYVMCALSDTLCCSDPGSASDSSYYFVDMKTGEVHHCTLTNLSLGWSLDILADAGDQVLLIYDYDAKPSGGESYEITKYHYGLIAKTDLYNSRANYLPIEMTTGGKK